MRSALLVPMLAAALLAGCQDDGPPPVPASCPEAPEAIVRALATAPEAVTLPGGARISTCLRDAESDADLQNVGATFSRAAEDLEELGMGGDERAALQLGYLFGAARKGAEHTSGIGAELVRRIERSAAAVDGASPATAAAVQRGIAAGEARG